MIMAFAFLPTNCLEENINRFEKYIQSKTYYDDLLKVWKWFKNTYLCNNKEICIFNIRFWSSYFRIMNDSTLTTNTIEGWHRSLNFNVRIPHPNINFFIEELIKEQTKVEFEIASILHKYYDNDDFNKEIKNNVLINIWKNI
ncbi:hypothetical protein DMUE_2487 [Dictyocoela muelleri]|nr:hypothetical protein DMUE_2487 [Dictyocoela muelleri]